MPIATQKGSDSDILDSGWLGPGCFSLMSFSMTGFPKSGIPASGSISRSVFHLEQHQELNCGEGPRPGKAVLGWAVGESK